MKEFFNLFYVNGNALHINSVYTSHKKMVAFVFSTTTKNLKIYKTGFHNCYVVPVTPNL